ncbi:MAG TPA: ArsR family transcriptional regulator [Bacteroidetes bacterium]|nr:ArsR family transcriptional regulator [Bacteroidota bacterium]
MKDILNKLSKLLESRIRLGIMSALVINESMDFNSLKDLLDVTDGNLASHLRVLEENELIQVRKQFIERKPNTRYKATGHGKDVFNQHLDALEQLMKKK